MHPHYSFSADTLLAIMTLTLLYQAGRKRHSPWHAGNPKESSARGRRSSEASAPSAPCTAASVGPDTQKRSES